MLSSHGETWWFLSVHSIHVLHLEQLADGNDNEKQVKYDIYEKLLKMDGNLSGRSIDLIFDWWTVDIHFEYVLQPSYLVHDNAKVDQEKEDRNAV